MVIRKASYGETQKILNHAIEIMKEATMGQVEPTEEKAHQMISSFLSGEGYYLVHADKDNILQGWIGIGKTLDFYTGEMVGIIPEIFVLPTYRKQGIAEKLCKQALSHLKAEGYQKVQLHVFSGNHAKHLYQKLGFREVSTLMAMDLNNSV